MFKLIPKLSHFNVLPLNVSRRLMSTQESEILFENLNNAGIITLNRPEVLNAINTSMAAKLLQKLPEWKSTKTCVIIKGAGGRAFCAGGDLKAIISDIAITKKIDKVEYNLNYMISKYKSPYIVIMNGIAMGRGLGLALFGRYKVATETTVAAMPETNLGMFPDIGASYFLARMQGNIGLYLGLTGARLKGGDVVRSGIATHFVPSFRLQELELQLTRCWNELEIQALLNKFHEPSVESFLAENIKDINYCFAAETVEMIIKRLQTVKSEWSNKTLEILHSVSPSAVKITLRALQRGAQLELDQCLKMEYRVACHSPDNPDCTEGVRALLIDKDNNPKWNPSTLDEVTDEYVESFFRKLPEDQELKFFDSKIKNILKYIFNIFFIIIY